MCSLNFITLWKNSINKIQKLKWDLELLVYSHRTINSQSLSWLICFGRNLPLCSARCLMTLRRIAGVQLCIRRRNLQHIFDPILFLFFSPYAKGPTLDILDPISRKERATFISFLENDYLNKLPVQFCSRI